MLCHWQLASLTLTLLKKSLMQELKHLGLLHAHYFL